jgi:multidrug efflux pump subunit AcrA (membrane-fusion protein)
MSRQIFRKVALERLSSPEQLDQLMKVTTPRGWLALLALIALLAMAAVWSVFGNIPTQVAGSVIFVKTGGVKNIESPYAGQIVELLAQVGDVVQEGEVVARVSEEAGGSERAIISPYTGRILEVKVDLGHLVDRGTSLMNLELVGEDVKLEGIMYVPLADGKKIAPGMDVQLSPSTVSKETYGYMLGKVAEVGTFPATYEGILRTLGSDDLVEALNIQTAPIQIQIELLPDPATASSFRWSSPGGPPTSVESGTIGTAIVITGQQHPINLVLPTQ